MYRIEIEHEGHWLVGESSGIGDLGGEFQTLKEARATIKACADTEHMEERKMPRARVIDMRPASAAARALRAIPSEARTQASRENGKRPVKPGSMPRGRPPTKKLS